MRASAGSAGRYWRVPGRRLILLFVAIYLIWGFTYVAVRLALRDTAPFTLQITLRADRCVAATLEFLGCSAEELACTESLSAKIPSPPGRRWPKAG